MNAADWLDIEFFKFISKHTSAVLAFIISIVLVSHTVEWALNPGLIKTYMEYLDRFYLVITSVYFPFGAIIHLRKEFKAHVRDRSMGE
jgi:hypothetical protein